MLSGGVILIVGGHLFMINLRILTIKGHLLLNHTKHDYVSLFTQGISRLASCLGF